MKTIGIIGGTGYTGGELIRLLSDHPEVTIDFIFSRTRAGDPVTAVHHDLLGETDLSFTGKVNPNVDIVFLCLGHGHSREFLKSHEFSTDTRVIDLSRDFRLSEDAEFLGRKFVYGLPELYRDEITSARNIANPGCFATTIQLALLPLAKAQLLKEEVHIHALTGSTGAGGTASATTHFTWRNNNVSWYKPFTHQHLGEIHQSLNTLQEAHGKLQFLPIRGNFTRGIFATAYTKFEGDLEQATSIYKDYYHEASFTHISDLPVHLKQVVNTNACHIHLHKHEDQLLVTAALDNLLKGASGQAVQNMNLMLGFEERLGLHLKGSIF